MTEVATFRDIDQFQAGQSVDMCGYYAAAMYFQSVAPGHTITVSDSQVLSMARSDYEHYAGPDNPSNMNGMNQDTLHSVLSDHRLQWIDYEPARIPFALQAGSPVFVCVQESSVWDIELNDCPYPWPTAGLLHIFLITGMDGNDYLARDSANIAAPNTLRPGPRRYSASRLQIEWATAGVPGWLPAPAPLPAPGQLLQASPADLAIWSAIRKDIPLVSAHGIPQSWLQAFDKHSTCFGPVLDQERTVTRNGVLYTEQTFTAGLARYMPAQNKTQWYTATGLVFSWP